MKGLLIKDICLLKMQIRFFVIIIFVAAMLGSTNKDVSFIMSYLTFVFSFFTISTISYDDMDNGMTFLLTLPVTKSQYVQSKYIFGILMILVSGILSLIMIPVCMMINPVPVNLEEVIFSCVVTVGSILLFLSVIFPLQFKFGAEKGRIVMFIILAIIVTVCYGAAKLLEIQGIDLSKLLDERVNVYTAMAAATGAGIVCYLISMGISVGIIKKKEY